MSSEETLPGGGRELPAATGQQPGDAAPKPVSPTQAVAATGGRKAFGTLRRDLTDEEVKHSGVAKVVLEDLDRAEAQCEKLEKYRDLYFEMREKAAVLAESKKKIKALDIAHTAGVGLGGALIGLAPSHGGYALALGIALFAAGLAVRMVQE